MISFRLSCFLFSLLILQSSAVSPNRGGNQNEEPLDAETRLLFTVTGEAGSYEVTSKQNNLRGGSKFFAARYHNNPDLCWLGNTEQDAITKYTGTVCPDGTIKWDSIKTVASDEFSTMPIRTPNGPCEWSRGTNAAWNAKFLGKGCGDSPNKMALSRNKEKIIIVKYETGVIARDAAHSEVYRRCGGSEFTYLKFEGTVCTHDRTKVIWNKMMVTELISRNVISCSNGKKAIWNRFDYDPVKDAKFINDNFGSCGVPPANFPNLKVTA